MLKVLMGLFVAVTAIDSAAAGNPPTDFDLDVLPVLTKFGCNSGACHGAAAGRGEFRLSLFGSRPGEDLNAIAGHLESRRVNRARPDRSLILLKPTGGVDHGGGVRFESGSREARILRQWISEGAIRNGQTRVVALSAEPSIIVTGMGAETPIRFLGTLNNGDVRDVTADISLSNADPDSVSVSENSVVIPHRSGRHVLIARYPGLVLPVEVLVPFSDVSGNATATGTSSASNHLVDRRIAERLNSMNLQPCPAVDDSSFLCRATLSLTGRRPRVEQVRSFLQDDSPSKRGDLIDELMRSPEFIEYWTWQLARMLRVSDSRSVAAASAWQTWLRAQLVSEVPLNRVAAKMILAMGDPETNGPAAFHTVSRDARSQAEQFSETLLGIRMRCANCHDHPLDRWTQDEYHGLAAIFATVDRGSVISSSSSGTTIHPVTGLPAKPLIPLSTASVQGSHSRIELGRWLEDPGNRFFARNFVNRIWRQLMGRGLVEPVDDLRVTNPPTHPELLDELAASFAESGFQLKPLIRVICRSDVWSRSSSHRQDFEDSTFWSSRPRSRLAPEVLLDCLGDVTGLPEVINQSSEPGLRMIQVAKLQSPSATLEALGRCSENRECAGGDISSMDSLPVALHLVNGELLNRRLTPDAPLIRQLMEKSSNHAELIEEVYLRILSRFPYPAEAAAWAKELEAARAENRVETTVTDLVWALLTSEEFFTCP